MGAFWGEDREDVKFRAGAGVEFSRTGLGDGGNLGDCSSHCYFIVIGLNETWQV